MTLVVITNRILILPTLVIVVTVIVIATLLFQSAVPFPTEHVTSSSQKTTEREREMSTACCDKSGVSLWKQIQFCSHDKSGKAKSGETGHVASPMVEAQLTGGSLSSAAEQLREEDTGAESTGGRYLPTTF